MPRRQRITSMPARSHRAGILALAVACVLTGCAGGDEPDGAAQPTLSTTAERIDPRPPTVDGDDHGVDDDAALDGTSATRPTARELGDPPRDEQQSDARIAEAVGSEVAIFAAPGDGARQGEALHDFTNPTPIGAPLVFLVVDEQDDWLEVLIPVRPNGSTGWIQRDRVTITETGYHLVVELGNHHLTVRDHGEVVLEVSIGVGGDGSPTPPGLYYITELLQPPDPTGPYGPYAFGLSGFSEVHETFAGGQGVIGLHGTDDPSSIGRDSSAGCIRLDNEVIRELAALLPLGTPVEIVA